MESQKLKIGLLHLAPIPGALQTNRDLIEHGLRIAADAGAQWILTPELATTGYSFSDLIGTDWIGEQPDEWTRSIAAFARQRQVAVFLAVPERRAGKLANSVIAIDRTGQIAGRHSKINTLKIGSEAWSSPGDSADVVRLTGFGEVGVMICADACSPEIARKLVDQGARAIVSAAAWSPGDCGPSGEWEMVSRIANLPVFVCNRTGVEPIVDFSKSESVVAYGGERLISLASITSAVFLFEWDFLNHRMGDAERLPFSHPVGRQ